MTSKAVRIGIRRAAAWAAAAVAVLALATCRSSPAEPAFERLEITTATLPAATQWEPYAKGVEAVGGDGAYEWSILSGELPDGLELSVDGLTSQALISGTPETAGTTSFLLRVRSGDGQTATRTFDLLVTPPTEPLAIRSPAVPPALQGAPYNVALRAERADDNDEEFEWTLVGGSLPAGLSLTAGGRIQGTPTTIETTTFTAEVRSGGLSAEREFSLRVVPEDTDAFRITFFEVASFPDALRPHVDAAIAKWEAAVVGNLSPATIPEDLFDPGWCGGFGVYMEGVSTDDIMIVLNIASIDGPGGVLARAGTCAIRLADSLPAVGIVILDLDDMLPIAGFQRATDIIVHEIAHALGFGPLWNLLGLIEGAGTDDPRFTGPQAVAEYEALGGTGGVPLETQGGPATRDAHWSKPVFGPELMTGFIEPLGERQPLSRVSIAAQADLGFTVDLSAADAFSLPAALLAQRDGLEPGLRLEPGWEEIYTGPIHVIGPDGRSRILELP